MSQITVGIGMSHTPRLIISPEHWHHFPSFAKSMGGFVDVDGRIISGQELIAKYEGEFSDQATLAAWQKCYQITQAALKRLKQTIHREKLDALIVIGDDQHELLNRTNYPSLLVFCGAEFKMADRYARSSKQGNSLPSEVVDQMATGFFMDKNHLYPNEAPLAKQIVKEMINTGMTPAIFDENSSDPAYGVGHAFGVVVKTLLQETGIPIVPIVVNNYFPPNQPTPQICWKLGEVINTAVQKHPKNLNIGVIASGGLSHFVVDEAWDHHVLTLMREGDSTSLQAISVEKLQSGNSEVLNWIATAAACQHLTVQWDQYAPVYSQSYREGVGLAFMEWS